MPYHLELSNVLRAAVYLVILGIMGRVWLIRQRQKWGLFRNGYAPMRREIAWACQGFTLTTLAALVRVIWYADVPMGGIGEEMLVWFFTLFSLRVSIAFLRIFQFQHEE